MKTRIDMKSVIIGAVAAVGLCFLVGATGSGDRPGAIGRFQIACTNTLCYLVDTATGQVWQSGDREFKSAKLQDRAAAVTGEATGFVGRWDSDHPEEDDLTIRLEAGGRALATEGSRRHEGSWRVEGARLFITIDDETVTGELDPAGRLILWEEGDPDEKIPFHKVQ
ncbi:MAG: hypothetical protein JW741_02635 [Sedimentisphaerales bacterium]|nr:hypothetical protein [Sedimentisphaerales bacterium]